jgi:iron(III) transport system substrate-binding protein
VFAEPILEAFTRETGLEVQAVFDSEAVKSVGLANRILAEQAHPVADVFWGNEEFQTRRLAKAGAFRATNGWAAFGRRSRRLAVGSDRANLAATPFIGLTNTALRGKVSLALPWFGSTLTHFVAMRAEWGEGRWRQWCHGLAANRPFLEEGNSQVVKRVARGEAWLGLTDSDDIRSIQREGVSLVAGPEIWPLRNTVAVLRGAPHGAAAEKLFQYLQSPPVQDKLYLAGALEVGEPSTTAVEPSWDAMLQEFEATAKELREIFTP